MTFGWKSKLVVLLALLLMPIIGLAIYAPKMVPISDGTAAEFWLCACGISVNGKGNRTSAHAFYQPRDGWMIYYRQGYHGQFLYRVKESESLELFPAVVKELQQAPEQTLHPDVEKAFKEWTQEDLTRSDALGLLSKIREKLTERVQKENPEHARHFSHSDSDFSKRWHRVQRYQWNIALEAVLFCGLVLFALLPWLRNAGWIYWALHLSLLPFLLFLPFYLGYARFTFTSAGPCGGVLYPWVIFWIPSFDWNSLDIALFQSFPLPLEPISQTTGPMLSLSGGRGGWGPFSVLCLGVLLGAVVWAIHVTYRNARGMASLFPKI